MHPSSKPMTISKVKVITSDGGAIYTLDRIVDRSGVSRKLVLDLCKARVIIPFKGKTPATYRFHEETIYRIRKAHWLMSRHNFSISAVRAFLFLTEENERLQRELVFWKR